MKSSALVCLVWVAGCQGGLQRAPCALPLQLSDGWQSTEPSVLGFDSAALCEVLEATAGSSANVHSVVVERHGQLVAELYRDGIDGSLWVPATLTHFGPDVPHDMRSLSKSVVGLAVGLMFDDGLLDPSTPVLDFYPEFIDLQRSPALREVRLEHLLTMTSGLEWHETLTVPNDETALFVVPSPAYFVLSRAPVASPGTTFVYHGGSTDVLADVVARVSGKRLSSLTSERLFAPLGITDVTWLQDPLGREIPFAGLRIRPRDMLKVGRLVLNRGEWGGRSILSSGWLDAATAFHVAAPPVPTGTAAPPANDEDFHYGYQFWGGVVPWHGRTLRWAAGFGNGGQRLFMVPELDLAVMITAGDYGQNEIRAVVDSIFRRIVASVEA